MVSYPHPKTTSPFDTSQPHNEKRPPVIGGLFSIFQPQGENMDILRDPLRDALGLVSKAVGSSSTLPILACVDLQADKDGLTLTANNLEMVIRTRIDARITAPFATAIPAAVLTNIILASDAGVVALDFDEPNLTV